MTNRALQIIHNILSLLEEDESKIEDISDYKKVSGPQGSNSGGVYQHPTKGTLHYVKISKYNGETSRNEVLSNEFLKKLKVPVLDHKLVKINGKLGNMTSMQDLKDFDPENPKHRKDLSKHFGAHAYVENWDVHGTAGSWNNSYDHKGNLVHVDPGGSLSRRAQGELKGSAFSDKVGAFDSLRNKNINPETHRVFGSMKPHEIVDSIRPVAKLKNSDIHDLIQKHGPVDATEKQELAAKMIARKKDIIGRANSIASEHNLKPVRDVDES